MLQKGMTIRDAAQVWLNGFSAIPYGLVEKAYQKDGYGYGDIREITPISRYDQVYIFGGKYDGMHGTVLNVDRANEMVTVQLDESDKRVKIKIDRCEVHRDSLLPMWSTMWMFGESIDDHWLENMDGLQAMADCGFRIYEIEEGYIFGIDGAGYSFYDEHWIPLYKVRGLQWHDEEAAC